MISHPRGVCQNIILMMTGFAVDLDVICSYQAGVSASMAYTR